MMDVSLRDVGPLRGDPRHRHIMVATWHDAPSGAVNASWATQATVADYENDRELRDFMREDLRETALALEAWEARDAR